MRLTSFLFISFCVVAPASVIAATLQMDGAIDAKLLQVVGPAPVWHGNYMRILDANFSPTVRFLGWDGAEASPLTFSYPSASVIRTYDAYLAASGQAVACGVMHDRDGRTGGYLALVERNRSETKLVNLALFTPFLCVPDEDGSIWVQGHENNLKKQSDRGVLRHYSATGKWIEEFLPQSKMHPLDAAMNLNALAVGGGKVGWYSRNSSTYHEVSGGKLAQFPGPPFSGSEYVHGLAITRSGNVYASVNRFDAGSDLYRLDRADGTWKLVSLPSKAKFSILYGGGADRLAVGFANAPEIQIFVER